MDAGVADQLVLGDPKAPRFVYWDKKLRPTPSGEGGGSCGASSSPAASCTGTRSCGPRRPVREAAAFCREPCRHSQLFTEA